MEPKFRLVQTLTQRHLLAIRGLLTARALLAGQGRPFEAADQNVLPSASQPPETARCVEAADAVRSAASPPDQTPTTSQPKAQRRDLPLRSTPAGEGQSPKQQAGSNEAVATEGPPLHAEHLSGAGAPAAASGAAAGEVVAPRSRRSGAEPPSARATEGSAVAAVDTAPGHVAAAGCRASGLDPPNSSSRAVPGLGPGDQPQTDAGSPVVSAADHAQSPRPAAPSASPQRQSPRSGGGSAAPRGPAPGSTPGDLKPPNPPLNPPASLTSGAVGTVFTNPFFESDPAPAADGRDGGSSGAVENSHNAGSPAAGSPARQARSAQGAAGADGKAGSPGEIYSFTAPQLLKLFYFGASGVRLLCCHQDADAAELSHSTG